MKCKKCKKEMILCENIIEQINPVEDDDSRDNFEFQTSQIFLSKSIYLTMYCCPECLDVKNINIEK